MTMFFKLLNPVNIIVTLMLLLGGALFVFGAPNIDFQDNGPHRDLSKRSSSLGDWGDARKSCYFAMYAERADGGGDLSITGYREPLAKNADGSIKTVRYRVYAQATAWSGWRGRANAWVNLTPRDGGIVHDQGGPRASDVDGDGDPWYMSASDSHVRNAHGIGQRRILGGASLALPGGGKRVFIKVVLTGV